MSKTESGIKLKRIEFNDHPFRKLKNLKIEFSDRITLIAGHNGIGKSTILGLIANNFGLGTPGTRSYFGTQYSSSIEKIVYISLDEVADAQKHNAPGPLVRTDYFSLEITKRCALTQRSEWKRARVVPRTVDNDVPDEGEKKSDDIVGPDAKIPFPSIYLGMKRIASIGESDENDVSAKKSQMHEDDRALMVSFVKHVIVGSKVNNEATEVKSSKKKAVHPGYDHHEALAVSMGQDSLGSIATALASFNKLKREQGDSYQGGLLIIDELDVGFHPHAIQKLSSALKSYAKKLNLQVVATTHSPILIESVHPDGSGKEQCPDSVVYLIDTNRPRMAEDQSLDAILSDMRLEIQVEGQKSAKPVLPMYFEDEETFDFFNGIINGRKRGAIGKQYGVKIETISLRIPGSNLLALPDKDPLFLKRILVADADITFPKKARDRGNSLKLPCVTGASGTDRSPENTIKKFIHDMAYSDAEVFRTAMLGLNINNPSTDKLIDTFLSNENSESSERTSTKKWWATHRDSIIGWKIIEAWGDVYKKEVSLFLDSFKASVESTSKLI